MNTETNYEEWLASQNKNDYNLMIELKKKFIIPALEDALFLFPLSTTDFYDTVHGAVFDEDTLSYEKIMASSGRQISSKLLYELDDNKKAYYRQNEVKNSARRLKNLFKRLYNSNDIENFFAPKIYDQLLSDCIVHLHNGLASRLRVMPISKAMPSLDVYPEDMRPPGDILKNNTAIDVMNVGYRIPFQYLKRDGFNFIELIFLSCLFLSVKSQSITVLNKVATTKDQIVNAKRRLTDFYKELTSQDFQASAKATLLIFVLGYCAQDYRKLYYEYIEKYVLTEKQKERAAVTNDKKKYIDSVVSSLYKEKKEKAKDESIESTSDEDISKYEMTDYFRQCNVLSDLSMVILDIGTDFLPDNLIKDGSDFLEPMEGLENYLLSSDRIGIIEKEKIRNSGKKPYGGITYGDYAIARAIAQIVVQCFNDALQLAPELFRSFEEYRQGDSILLSEKTVIENMRQLI